MLCNRPEEGPKAAEAGPKPFKTTCAPTYGEQLEKQQNEALVRHHKWLKQLAEEVAEGKKEEISGENNELREEAKKVDQKMRAADVAAAVEGKKKPKWAMTEKASAEMDEEETLELLDFADNLNFDEYMNDLEFREALQAMQGRANKLQGEQDKFRDMISKQFNEAEDDGAEAEAQAEDG